MHEIRLSCLPGLVGRRRSHPRRSSRFAGATPATPPASPRAPSAAGARSLPFDEGAGTLARDASVRAMTPSRRTGRLARRPGRARLCSTGSTTSPRLRCRAWRPRRGAHGRGLGAADDGAERVAARRLAAAERPLRPPATSAPTAPSPASGLNTSGGGNENTGAGSVNPGEWRHCGVYDGRRQSLSGLYPNGAERATLAERVTIQASSGAPRSAAMLVPRRARRHRETPQRPRRRPPPLHLVPAPAKSAR